MNQFTAVKGIVTRPTTKHTGMTTNGHGVVVVPTAKSTDQDVAVHGIVSERSDS